MLRLFGEKGRGTFVGLLGSPLGTGFSRKREGGLLWASWEVLWGPAFRGKGKGDFCGPPGKSFGDRLIVAILHSGISYLGKKISSRLLTWHTM